MGETAGTAVRIVADVTDMLERAVCRIVNARLDRRGPVGFVGSREGKRKLLSMSPN